MPSSKTKEQLLFEIILSMGETEGIEYHITKIDDEDCTRYRCDCGDIGSFELAKFENCEEFNKILDDQVEKEEIRYLYDGKYSDKHPELDIDAATDHMKKAFKSFRLRIFK